MVAHRRYYPRGKRRRQTRDKIAELAVRFGGYVVSSSFRGQSQDMMGKISTRAMSGGSDAAMAEIRALGVRVASETTNTEDATAQYVDLQARLSNGQATEAQYLTLLNKADKRHHSGPGQVSQTRQTIEQLQGQIKYLETTSSTSLIIFRLPRPTACCFKRCPRVNIQPYGYQYSEFLYNRPY